MLLIATPAYGNNVTTAYLKSIIRLQEDLLANHMGHDFFILGNESLIHRARNVCVDNFLKGKWTHLMFIDADIEFESDDVAKLWNMDADVAVGAYRQKTDDGRTSVWADHQLTYEEVDNVVHKPIAVKYAGTGFMMIKRKVFEQMEVQEAEYGGKYFASEIKDGVDLSEDYYFCDKVRQSGMEVLLEPSIRLKHWGQQAWR